MNRGGQASTAQAHRLNVHSTTTNCWCSLSPYRRYLWSMKKQLNLMLKGWLVMPDPPDCLYQSVVHSPQIFFTDQRATDTFESLRTDIAFPDQLNPGLPCRIQNLLTILRQLSFFLH